MPDLMSIAWFLLRLVTAYMMIIYHGWGKLMRITDGNLNFSDPIGIGVEASLILVMFAEFFCSILVALGLFTRFAVLPLIFTMLVALLIQHGDDPISENWNIIAYLSAYIALFYGGAGRYSFDYKFWPDNRSDKS